MSKLVVYVFAGFFLVLNACSAQNNETHITRDYKVVHVYVSLCDNQFQGIVPVPASLGNGQDPKNNLYWGAGYGVKSYLRYKLNDWKLLKSEAHPKEHVLERVIFYNSAKNTYLVADAFDGRYIKDCIEEFIEATNGQHQEVIAMEDGSIVAGGHSDLTAFVGHDGLMDFDVDVDLNQEKNSKEFIILACYSRNYFKALMLNTGAEPRLWTTHLMAPEAYTLMAGVDSFLSDENKVETRERAAQAYHKYQKCGMKGARNLLTSNW